MDLTRVRPKDSGRPMSGRRHKTVGIDLGTTNTAVASNFRALPMEGQGCIMPSAVAFTPSGETLVGKPARRRRAMDPRNTVLSAKLRAGTPPDEALCPECGEYHYGPSCHPVLYKQDAILPPSDSKAKNPKGVTREWLALERGIR